MWNWINSEGKFCEQKSCENKLSKKMMWGKKKYVFIESLHPASCLSTSHWSFSSNGIPLRVLFLTHSLLLEWLLWHHKHYNLHNYTSFILLFYSLWDASHMTQLISSSLNSFMGFKWWWLQQAILSNGPVLYFTGLNWVYLRRKMQ